MLPGKALPDPGLLVTLPLKSVTDTRLLEKHDDSGSTRRFR